MSACALTAVIGGQMLAEVVTTPDGYRYEPLVREGVVWQHLVKGQKPGDGPDGLVPVEYTYYLQFKGDTVTDGKTYKKCYRTTVPELTPENGEVVAIAREEDRKVKAKVFRLEDGTSERLPGDGSEVMLYDFTKNTGDVWTAGFEGTVSGVDYISVGGKDRKRISFAQENRFPEIEGFGAVDLLGEGDPLLTPWPERMGTHPFIQTTLTGILSAESGGYLWSAFSDDYRYEPLVREGVEWKYCWRQPSVSESVPEAGVFYLRFDGKTEINGKTYSVCYRYESPDFKKEEAQIAGYAREEGHKVYAIISQLPNGRPYTTDMREDLIYDFDASVNDIVFGDMQVKDVRFVPINGTWHKVLYGYEENEPWAIDGIGLVRNPEWGSFGYLLYPFFDSSTSMFAYTAYLETVRETATSKIIYQCKDIWSSVGGIGMEAEKATVVQRGTTLVVTAEEAVSATLFSAGGRMVAAAPAAADGTVTIDVSGLPQGVYIVTVATADGSISQKAVVR